MTAVAPCVRIKSSILLLSYPGRDHTTSLYAAQQGDGLGRIRGLTSGESKAKRPAPSISHQVYLGTQTASGTPQSLLGSPFSTGCLLLGPNNGGINHDVSVVRVLQQHLEDPFT